MRHLPYKALVKVKELAHGKTRCTFRNAMQNEEFSKTVKADLTEIKAWATGTLIQNAMPRLSAEEREWFITGVEDWDALFTPYTGE